MDIFNNIAPTTTDNEDHNFPNELPAELKEKFLGEPFYKKKMKATVRDVRAYAEAKGKSGSLRWAHDSLNEAFMGVNTGIHVVAAESNMGKTAFLSQMGLEIATLNQEVTEFNSKVAFCLMFSLDDSSREFVPRIIAASELVPATAVRYPMAYQDNEEYMRKVDEGYKKLEQLAPHLNVIDGEDNEEDEEGNKVMVPFEVLLETGEYTEDDIAEIKTWQRQSIEYIAKVIEVYQYMMWKHNPDYQVVVLIDAFNDLHSTDPSIEKKEATARLNLISILVSRVAKKYDVPIIMSCHLRKQNGVKRPTNDDIRDANTLVYESKAIMLLYNDVSKFGQEANVYYELTDDDTKRDVIEIDISKNKYSSVKKRVFFEFQKEYSYMIEASEVASQAYTQKMIG